MFDYELEQRCLGVGVLCFVFVFAAFRVIAFHIQIIIIKNKN